VKRVLFVADNLFPLGPARALISAALSDVSLGTDVHLAASACPQHNEWLEGLPIAIHQLSANSKKVQQNGSWSSRRNLGTVIELRQLIRDLQPDAIHAGGEIAAGWTQLAALKLSVLASSRPELVYREFRIPQRPSLTSQWIANCVGTRFPRAIVSHFAIKNALINHCFGGTIEVEPVGLNQAQRIPLFNQIEPSAGRQRLIEHLGLRPSSKIAGTVAPLIPRSRIKDLIWATDQISVVRDDFHFVIWGTGSQYEQLKRFLACTEATGHVHFVGEPDDAWLMFQGLDVYWHSHLAEPLPLNLLMAMSLGIPVVSVLGAGTSDLILHQQTGLGVNFGGRDEFSRWTKYLIEQTDSASQIGAQGKRYIQNESWL
jgi:glycosyltransferase involved in cell wall biosynthesis